MLHSDYLQLKILKKKTLLQNEIKYVCFFMNFIFVFF